MSDANPELVLPDRVTYPKHLFFYKTQGVILPLLDDDEHQPLDKVEGEVIKIRPEVTAQIKGLVDRGYPLLLAVHAICNAHKSASDLPDRSHPTMLMATVGVPSVGKSAFCLFLEKTFSIPSVNMDPFSDNNSLDDYRDMQIQPEDVYSSRAKNAGQKPKITLGSCLDNALDMLLSHQSARLINLDCPGIVAEVGLLRQTDGFDLLRGATDASFWIIAGVTDRKEELEIVTRNNRLHFTYCPGPAFSNGEFNGNLRAENFDFLTSELSNRLPNVFKRV